MLFNSWGYLLFLLLAVPLHWIVPSGRLRIWILVAFSVLFYSMWRWEFSLLVLFSASVDYLAAARIHRSSSPRSRKSWLLLSLTINLGLLVAFKYTYFIYDNISFVATAAGMPVPDLGTRIILPLGISFYTFQTISYTIDVYRSVVRPTKNFAAFLCYVTFWPQLIAGPILRAGEVIPQLIAARKFSWARMGPAITLIVIGLFKKVVLADSLAPLVDDAFATDLGRLGALDVWVSAFLFGFQIYFDFSGYSDIAIGSARLLGLEFPDNFDWPYMARSPRELWTRWHISLSAWIRDYLYLPLTGQRFRTNSLGGLGEATAPSTFARNRALLLTWFIMGLWHGAAWTFALWGVYHATLIFLYRILPVKDRIAAHPVIAWAVMLPLSMAGWISFRAQSLGQAGSMYATIVDPRAYFHGGPAIGLTSYVVALIITIAMVALFGLQLRDRKRPFSRSLRTVAATLSIATMVCAVLICMRAVKQFIYFQF